MQGGGEGLEVSKMKMNQPLESSRKSKKLLLTHGATYLVFIVINYFTQTN